MMLQTTSLRTAGRSPNASRVLHDLPVRVLANDLPIAELEVVAPANPDLLTCRRGAREQPLGGDHVPAAPVPILAVVHVRKPGEPRGQPFPHGRLAHAPPPPRVRSAGHVQ